MPVSEELSSWSTNAASNSPGGSDNVGPDLDDHLRLIKSYVAKIRGSHWGTSEPGSGVSERGAIWLDSSGSASNVWIFKANVGGSYVYPFMTINSSAGTVYCPIDPTSAVPTSRTLTAGDGMSGGGTLSANRTFNIANVATATVTTNNAIMDLTIDPFGRLVSSSTAATIATSNQMEDRSSTSSYVTPVRMRDHLGVAKFWVDFDGSGTASIGASYNVASVVRSAAGKYTINFSSNFANTFYAVVMSSQGDAGVQRHELVLAKATDSVAVETGFGNFSVGDAERLHVLGFGYV